MEEGIVKFEPDSVAELCCNLDDMTGEDIAFALRLLMREGALDVWTTAIQMKKDRPGILLTCLCKAEEKERLACLILEHTSTAGVREKVLSRYVLERETLTRDTPLGAVRFKCRVSPSGDVREKPEYDELERIATEKGMSIQKVREAVENRGR
jgi:uncharacterized protein (DUF111 family)